MFKKPFAEHRVVVPGLGYYEWQERPDGKQPYFMHMPGEPLALSGIVRAWHDKTKPGDDLDARRLSMAIITLNAHVTPAKYTTASPRSLRPTPSVIGSKAT
ncbi:hypothetical protein BH09ACT5_BH09ACT5_03820 [soil metagenome]